MKQTNSQNTLSIDDSTLPGGNLSRGQNSFAPRTEHQREGGRHEIATELFASNSGLGVGASYTPRWGINE
jgi:hypothetical protein